MTNLTKVIASELAFTSDSLFSLLIRDCSVSCLSSFEELMCRLGIDGSLSLSLSLSLVRCPFICFVYHFLVRDRLWARLGHLFSYPVKDERIPERSTSRGCFNRFTDRYSNNKRRGSQYNYVRLIDFTKANEWHAFNSEIKNASASSIRGGENEGDWSKVYYGQAIVR